MSTADPRRTGRMTQHRSTSPDAVDRDPSARGLRAQGAPSRDVGLGRLPVHGRDVPAAAGAEARRGLPASVPACASSTSPPGPGTPRSPPPRPARTSPPATSPRAARGGPPPGRRRGARRSTWVEADAEHLPFDDAVLRRRHVLDRRDVRPAPPGGRRRARARLPPRRHDRAAELDPGGHDRRALRTIGPFAPPPPPGAQPPPLWGSEAHLRRAVRRPGRLRHARARRPRGHRVRAPARLRRALQGALRPDHRRPGERRGNGREAEFDAALDSSATSGTAARPNGARFEMEYLLAVGTRA